LANYWLAIGNPENWVTAFEYKNTWGLKPTQRHLWEALSTNDIVFFYATQPVIGILGYGFIKTKYSQDKPLWPQEIGENKVIWPLRFEFEVEKCLQFEEWSKAKINSEEIKRRTRSGFQRLSDDTAKWIISQFKSIQSTEYVQKPSVKPGIKETGVEKLVTPTTSIHSEVQSKLVEIGKIQGFLADPEYPIQIGTKTSRLDAVWRKLAYSVPTYAFEVQVGGDVEHALGKLKHAFDLWNSNIFIVASESDHKNVNNLLSGTFHEIDNRLKFIDLDRVEELYRRKKAYFEMERELGIKS
jgi:hypothetical protein